ncbi:MAG: hypothetical protein K0S51_1139 [Bacillales bacterium]|jgi:hypothetical protein|nr:hypothetical protein [Bacillales bacterium]
MLLSFEYESHLLILLCVIYSTNIGTLPLQFVIKGIKISHVEFLNSKSKKMAQIGGKYVFKGSSRLYCRPVYIIFSI